MSSFCRIAMLVCMFSASLCNAGAIAAETENEARRPSDENRAFAVVGDTTIYLRDFQTALRRAVREKFYHGKPEEKELAELRLEVGGKLVDKVLLIKEAKRRGLSPNAESIKLKIKEYEQKYADSERWKKNRERIIPGLTTFLEKQSLLEKLREEVNNVPEASPAQVREYYAANPDKFTEPAKMRLSVILMKIDPSSEKAIWSAGEEKAAKIVGRLKKGEDFAPLAKEYSDDASAENGGDLGYVHVGMLAARAQSAINPLSPGEFTEPVRLLEGYSIFRLDNKTSPKLHEFNEVKQRALKLLARERKESIWKELKARLREQTPVRVFENPS